MVRSGEDSKWNIVRRESQFGNVARAMLLWRQSSQNRQPAHSAAPGDKTTREPAIRKRPKRSLANGLPSQLLHMGISVLSSGLMAE